MQQNIPMNYQDFFFKRESPHKRSMAVLKDNVGLNARH